MKNLTKLNLHLFDGAAATGSGGEGAQAGSGLANHTGSEDLSKVRYGKTPDEVSAMENNAQGTQTGFADQGDASQSSKPSFDELIKGEYKQAYEDRLKATMEKRFKNMDKMKADLESLQSFVDPLYDLYEVEKGDLTGLKTKYLTDNGRFEDAAIEMGMTTEQYMNYLETRKQNEAYQRAEQERMETENAQRIYDEWMTQAEELKKEFPEFDLESSIEDPKFMALLRDPEMDVATAYKALHLNEILTGSAHAIAEATRQSTVDSIRARGMRPSENGLSESPGIVRKTDASKFTSADRKEIARRVAQGENIVL